MRRYVFRAGAPTALVRHSLAWEGALCPLGELSCGPVNGLLLDSSRDLLFLQMASPWAMQVVGDREQAALTGSLSEIHTASVHQLLRSSRFSNPEFQAFLAPPVNTTGDFADGAMMAASTASGAVAIALRDMHLYEPQGLMLQGGRLEIRIANGPTWLGARQGLFANFAVSALPASPSRALLDRQVWAPLNRPLRAWPSPAWWAASRAVEEFPVGALPADLASYDTRVPAVLQKTENLAIDRGLQGLQTRGVWPRYWGDPLLSDEIGCGANDPTPADDWDDVYWCSIWADYHNAGATAAIWAFRSGQVEWLDRDRRAGRLAHAAHRDPAMRAQRYFFYCGQAPTGYGGYRSDNNGSHAYFDNLLLYYWLTGDEEVVETLRKGASTMRGYLCPGRGSDPPGPMCGPNDLIPDAWAGLNGRVASQWYRVFRFLGLASGDGTYLDDWRGNVGRWLTQYWAQPGVGAGSAASPCPPAAAASTTSTAPAPTAPTSCGWPRSTTSTCVERLAVDSQDAPVGNPPLAPSAAEIAWARSLAQIGSATPWSTGTPAGPWPNVVSFTWSGPRVGGTLTALGGNHIDADGDGTPCELCDDDGDGDNQTCADVCLYDEGKSALSRRPRQSRRPRGRRHPGRPGEAVRGFRPERPRPRSPAAQQKNRNRPLPPPRRRRPRHLGNPQTPLFADSFESGSIRRLVGHRALAASRYDPAWRAALKSTPCSPSALRFRARRSSPRFLSACAPATTTLARAFAPGWMLTAAGTLPSGGASSPTTASAPETKADIQQSIANRPAGVQTVWRDLGPEVHVRGAATPAPRERPGDGKPPRAGEDRDPRQAGRELIPVAAAESLVPQDPQAHRPLPRRAQYAGRTNTRRAPVDAVTLDGDRLFVESTGEPKVEIFPESATGFAKGQPWRLVFVPGPQARRGLLGLSPERPGVRRQTASRAVT